MIEKGIIHQMTGLYNSVNLYTDKQIKLCLYLDILCKADVNEQQLEELWRQIWAQSGSDSPQIGHICDF